MLKPGAIAPEFILPDENGIDVSLSSLLNEGPLILYFYPADFTPGCTKEACAFRDLHGDIVGVGLQVVGVSPQDGDSPIVQGDIRRVADIIFSRLKTVKK